MRCCILLILLVMAGSAAGQSIRVQGRGFSLNGKTFVPWGFNYDHDASEHLLEEYWETDWDRVAGDFEEMKALGANTVRIHLQLSKFLNSPSEPNGASLARLSRLLRLSEKVGLYLDITGLGCYSKPDVPPWYDALGEEERWQAQAAFWEAVAAACSKSPAVFCYDLMNEPIIGDAKKEGWLAPPLGRFHFVQRIALDLHGRTQKEVASRWTETLTVAIRKGDTNHLITVGAIPWALTWPGAKPLFYAPEVSKTLDFVSLHFYPKKGQAPEALKALAVYDIGKPMVIEEMFPLHCSLEELDRFIDGSKKLAAGWIGFYWGRTIPEYRAAKRSIGEAITLEWLEYFEKKAKTFRESDQFKSGGAVP